MALRDELLDSAGPGLAPLIRATGAPAHGYSRVVNRAGCVDFRARLETRMLRRAEAEIDQLNRRVELREASK